MNDSKITFWILRAQSGDRDAFDSLLRVYQHDLLRYLVSLIGHQADAEDALQTTFVQVYRKLSWLRDPRHFRAWLFRIASRVAYRQISKRQGQKEFSNVEVVEPVVHNADLLVQEEMIEQLPSLLEKLTLKGREVCVLHFLEEFSIQQVADILDIPLGTVKSRISYALQCLRTHLKVRRVE